MSVPFFHFVLSINQSLASKISAFKKEAKSVIGSYASMNAKAHITVNNYPRKPVYLNEHWFNMFDGKQRLFSPISLEIDGFDYFENNNNMTIYAKLKWDNKIEEWFNCLYEAFGSISSKPHITIARAITPDQFALLWPHFENRDFQEKFKVNELAILENHPFDEDSHSNPIHTFTFEASKLLYRYKGHSKNRRKTKTYSSANQQISLF